MRRMLSPLDPIIHPHDPFSESPVARARFTAALPSTAADAAKNIYVGHLILPLLFAAVLLFWLEYLSGNRWIADQIYAWQGGQWLLKRHVITSRWIHPGGKYLSLVLWCAVFWVGWQSKRTHALAPLRRPLTVLLLSTLSATCLVTALKSLIAMDCPWDMQAYGGLRPYFGLFDLRPAGLRSSGCFPSGHASAGYAWVALYFYFSATAPRWRWHGLALGLLLGAVFGISQQLRGAHFASHDVVALLVCWLTALALHLAMRPRAARSRR